MTPTATMRFPDQHLNRQQHFLALSAKGERCCLLPALHVVTAALRLRWRHLAGVSSEDKRSPSCDILLDRLHQRRLSSRQRRLRSRGRPDQRRHEQPLGDIPGQ